ncbi:hypothetical protein ACFQRB_05110 [Halobaculum litoreum]|uniref:Uncharacterized protein n=1 Tax=Halobaculum litoreum TaxID=3031998 RepID=A0ABD5XLZ7_9EURY
MSRSGHPPGSSTVHTCGVPEVSARNSRRPSGVVLGESAWSTARKRATP